VAALRQAWEEAAASLTLEEAAGKHAELRQSVEKFGKPKPSTVGDAER
jgi:ribulose 1,5-bisphosphate carboxylase large subunit-like protein